MSAWHYQVTTPDRQIKGTVVGSDLTTPRDVADTFLFLYGKLRKLRVREVGEGTAWRTILGEKNES